MKYSNGFELAKTSVLLKIMLVKAFQMWKTGVTIKAKTKHYSKVSLPKGYAEFLQKVNSDRQFQVIEQHDEQRILGKK